MEKADPDGGKPDSPCETIQEYLIISQPRETDRDLPLRFAVEQLLSGKVFCLCPVLPNITRGEVIITRC